MANERAAAASGPDRRWEDISPRELIRRRYFPDALLTTQSRRRVRLYMDLIKDKVVLLNFFYASCEALCPRVTRNLAQVQTLLGERMGRDVFFCSFSLDPLHDSPDVLRAYAEMHEAGPGWSFLTGEAATLDMLRRRLGFTDPDPARDRDRENHIGNVRYGNEARQLWGACPGLSRPEFIVESLSWVT